eukprot:4751248-Karenia_brevis.AAC.1
MCDQDVLIKIQMPRVETHLRIARLKFFRNMINNIQQHELYIVTLFDRYVFENEVETNPWLEQYYQDFEALSKFDNIADVCEQLSEGYKEKKGQVLRIMMEDQDMLDQFNLFDLAQLKPADYM